MLRPIEGFSKDEAGDWVATLSCGHGQHTRHQPPFFNRPWVETEKGRNEKLGTQLDCIRCDQLEMPEGFEAYRRTPVFHGESIPAGLRKAHRTKKGVWAMIRCASGQLKYVIEEPIQKTFMLDSQNPGVVVPEVPHWIEPLDDVEVYVEFFKKPVHAGSP